MKKSQEKKLAILSAAESEIIRNGLSAVSLNSIVSCSGFSKGALYHHFSSKEQLLQTLLKERVFDYLEAEWIRPLMRSKAPLETLERIHRDCFALSDRSKSQQFELLIVFLNEYRYLDKTSQELLWTLASRWLRLLTKAISGVGGVKNNSGLSRIKAKPHALLLLSTILGAWSLQKITGSSMAYRDFIGLLREPVL